MVGTKGRSGGPRDSTGNGGAREGAGHPEGTIEVMPKGPTMQQQRWQFAEYAVQHAYEALNVLIEIMRDKEAPSAARASAAAKILDRALGKAPLHIDVTALRHTEIVYRSADEIRKVLAGRGLPPLLLSLVGAEKKSDDGGESE